MANQNAKQDSNQFPSLIVVQGTAGTADVNGTAPTMTVGGDPATGAMYVYDLAGGGAGTAGTVVQVQTGTLALATRVGNIGTLESGTIIPNGGTITQLSKLATGTINLATAVVSSGSIAMTAGTITGGTLIELDYAYISSGNGTTAVVDNKGTGFDVYKPVDFNGNSLFVPTLPYTYSGTSWNRLRGDITNGMDVDVTRVQGGSIVVTTGTINTGTMSISPLSGVVLAGTLGVGTTATALPASALASRKSVIVYNEGTTTIYLGGSGVTASTGLPVGTADYSPSFDLGTTILYGICSTAGGTARVLEVS